LYNTSVANYVFKMTLLNMRRLFKLTRLTPFELVLPA
jgi:hypothetical protein